MSSSKKQSTELESTLDANAVAEVLESVAQGLRGTEMRVHGKTPVVLNPAGVIEFKLEAKQKPKKASLSLKMSWQPPLIAGVRITSGSGPAPSAARPVVAVDRRPTPTGDLSSAPNYPARVEEVEQDAPTPASAKPAPTLPQRPSTNKGASKKKAAPRKKAAPTKTAAPKKKAPARKAASKKKPAPTKKAASRKAAAPRSRANRS